MFAEVEVQTVVMIRNGSPFYLIAKPEVAAKSGFRRLTSDIVTNTGTAGKIIDYSSGIQTMIVDQEGRVEEKLPEDNLE